MTILSIAAVLSPLPPAAAQALPEAGHGVLIRPAALYLSPDETSQKIADIKRGQEVGILETSRDWIHVIANLGENTPSGWLRDKGVIRANTPNGDQILFGEAADSEAEASRAHGRAGAAQDAMRLYAWIGEYFPSSPLAPEAAFRAADIRWQLERADVMSRPSALRGDPRMRSEMNEDFLRKVIRKYPHSKWADLAAFDLLDNKMCGEWSGNPKCPERESEIYGKYAAEHPQSPRAAEALYNAAWRQAALIEMYKATDASRSQQAAQQAASLAGRVASRYPGTDWAARGQRLLYMVQNHIPAYGNEIE